MRPGMLLAMLGVAALLLVPQAAGAATQSFQAHFTNVLPKKAPFCPQGPIAFCGSGSVSGFGAASYSLIPTSVGPVTNGCAPLTGVATITLANGGGSFTATVTATACFPGNSNNAPGQLVSFGNPVRAQGTFVISGGSGLFAGASGDGGAAFRAAGAQSKLDASGTITF